MKFDDEAVSSASVETRLIHGEQPWNSTSAVVPPIYQTATFRASSTEDFAERAGEPRHPEFYTRYGNPNCNQVEHILADLEGAEAALVTGSGMGAITAAVLALVNHPSRPF